MYPQVFGKYVLERELARGGMARVLLATLRGAGGFEKKLVVKQIRDELALDEDFVRRFVEEAKTTVALSHPNIVPVYELGVERGTYFLAMELVEGVSVSELLRNEKKKTKLTPEEGAYIGVEICRALDYAHRRMQVVHRDITPRNVMIDEEGQIKLIDFGIAARAAASTDTKEKDRRVFGSPGHMPPEQIAGKELGPATDLFAVAVLLMEAWSGHAPFRRKTPEESEAAMKAPHPKPSEYDIRLLPLDEPIARAMSLDPATRQQEADELGRALRKFLQEMDLGDVARGLGDRTRATREREAAREQHPTIPEGASSPHKSDGDPATATFAARDEIKKLSEAPGPNSDHVEIGTRKLAFLTPAIPMKVQDAPDVPIETVATQPIETPVGRLSARSPEKTSPSRFLVGGAAFAILAGVIVWQQAHTNGASTTTDPNPSAKPTSTASVPSASASSINVAPPASTPTPTSTTNTAPSASASAQVVPQGDARLSLFGDPGTHVSIDGASRGACPVRDVSVSAGMHEVRFTFDPTGESRSEQIKVASGGHATLRADFTGPTPMVHVEH
jgi:eukaryotic-like serine/threonine-protein kinase